MQAVGGEQLIDDRKRKVQHVAHFSLLDFLVSVVPAPDFFTVEEAIHVQFVQRLEIVLDVVHDCRVQLVLLHVDLEGQLLTGLSRFKIEHILSADHLVCVMGEAVEDVALCKDLLPLIGHLQLKDHTREIWNVVILVFDVWTNWLASFNQPHAHILILVDVNF